MKVEYINSFIKAITSVLKSMTNEDFTVGKPYIENGQTTNMQVLIIVGISGDMKGKAIIGMNMDAAKHVASSMMMGFPVTELDSMSKSALSELGNMVVGNAATFIYNYGHKIEISIPTLIVSSNVSMFSDGNQTIMIPMKSTIGELIFSIGTHE
jgi:chemotaxis protein CheX